jgi:hypothetical protein
MIATIEAIVRSPMLEKYNIGITVDSTRRRSQYKNFEPTWPHYVILKSGLSAKDALKIEHDLFTQATSNKRSILYKKYRGDSREKSYKPGLGGLEKDNDKLYDIYIAWGDIGDN